MRAICHIGHHKTGTTTLQAFLSQNSHRLLQAGLLYPWVEFEGAAHALAKATHTGDQAGILPINIREAHNALAFRMLADTLPGWTVPPYHHNLPHSRQMLLALTRQIEALLPDLVVLCSEVMSHFGKSAPAQIKRLREDGLRLARRITLWCTLRRPDEQLVSWHGQQVRFGQAPVPLSDPERGLNLGWLHVDYRSVIEPWLQQIPGIEPVLRPYGEVLASGGSVEDFRRHGDLGLLPSGLIPAPTMNVGYKPAVLSLLREANRSLPKPLAQVLAHQIGELTAGMVLADTREVEFLGPASRARLAAHFAPIHDWLSQTAGGRAFFPDIDQIGICRPISEAEALRALLDQLSPDRIAGVSAPEIREFLTRMCQQGSVSA
jgi:hypothetical protein